MHMLAEVFPVLSGVLVALICMTMRSAQSRWIAWAALSAVFGAIATVISGEYKISFGFLLFDVPLVAGISFSIMACQRAAKKIWSV